MELLQDIPTIIKTPKFIPLYDCVKNHKDIKALSYQAWHFIEYLMLKGYGESNQIKFKIKPKQLYFEYKIKRGKLYRLKTEIKKVKIDIKYENKYYFVNLKKFYDKYFPEHFHKKVLERYE